MSWRAKAVCVLVSAAVCLGRLAQAATPPVVTAQPTNTTILAGDSRLLIVVGQGDPAPNYQWVFNGTAIPGSTNNIHGIYGAMTPDQGEYYATLSNELGSVTSEVAFVKVITNPPAILSQPTNISVAVGQPAIFSINATGRPPPSYTWYFNETNKLIVVTKTVTFLSAQETHSGTYTVVLSNSVDSITSAPIVLTVSPLPLVTLQPTNQTLVEGDDLRMHVSAIGRAPLYYQWFFENRHVPGAIATNLIVGPAYPTNSGRYHCVVSNSAGTATSEVAVVTINPAPTGPGAWDLRYKPNTNGWIINDLILLEEDKLLVAGQFSTQGSETGVRRLHADGTIDFTLASNRFGAQKIALQPDGKILAASGNQLVRIDSAGIRDTNFTPSIFNLPDTIHDIGVQPGGRIIFVGYDSFGVRIYFGGLLPNGGPDRFFKIFEPQFEGGVRPRDEMKALSVLSGGAVILPAQPLLRLHPNGATDSSLFSPLGGTLETQITGIIPASNEREFFIIGTFTNVGPFVRNSIARLDHAGEVDMTFVPPTNLPGRVTAAAVQPDGKVVVAGFSIAGSNSVIRLKRDGSVDETFTPALIGTSGAIVNALAVQSDGKIIVGGGFIRVNARRIHGLARLYGDPPSPPEILVQPEDTIATVGQKVFLHATARAFGSVTYHWYRGDELVATERAPTLPLHSVALNDAGEYRLVVSSSHGAVTSQVARLTVEPNPDAPGAIAVEFPVKIDGPVNEMARTPDGRYVVAGNFNHVDGVPRPGLARINADGSLDTSFDPPETTPRDYLRRIRALAITASGSVYIGGAFTNVGGVKRLLIARLRPDGRLDGDFDPADALRYPETAQVNAIALQADGKVLAAGSFITTSNLARGGTAARFHVNGSVDTNFLHWLSGEATCLAVLNTNAILVGGTLRARDGGAPSAGVYRLRANGDQEYGLLTGFYSEIRSGVQSLVALPNGKILVGGVFQVPRTNGTGVARLMASGFLDPTFNPGIRVEYCSWIADAGCGKVLIGGSFQSVDGQPHRNLARLNANGTLDTTFDSQPFDGAVTTGVVLPSGDAVVGGEFQTAMGVAQPHIARINNGPYQPPSIATQPIAQSIAEGTSATLGVEPLCTFPPPTFQWQFNGTDLAGETNLGLNFTNTRLDRDGAYQLILSNAVGVITSAVAQLTVIRAPRVPGAPEIESISILSSNSVVRCLQALPDGKVLVGGSFSNMFGYRHHGLFRLNADASLDATFAYVGTNEVRALAVYPDGRIMINEWVPAYSSFLGNTRMFRLHSNGAIDTTFGSFPYYTYSWSESRTGPRSLAFDAANQLYVTREADVLRLFGAPWTKAINGTVHSLAFQPDGKLLLAGVFSDVSGVPQTNLARLQTNGLVDRPFVPWAGTLNCMALQPDGRIVVGGPFTFAGGLVRHGVARFHGDGSLDEDFHPQPGIDGVNASVNAIALQPDGKVIIGGSFTSYNGVPCNNIARLNPDGSLDPTFQPGTGIGGGANPRVNAIGLAEDGGIFVGGAFTTLNGVPRNAFARAYNNPKVLDFSRGTDVTSFSFLSLLDRTYVLEARGADEDAPWSRVQSLIGDGSIKTVTYPNATSDAALYRLRME